MSAGYGSTSGAAPPRPQEALIRLNDDDQAVGVKSTFVKLATGVPAALYEPDQAGRAARAAFVVMHPDGNFISHEACSQLARRGFRTLGVNSRFANLAGPTGGAYPFDEVLPDLGAAVDWLRELPGVERVALAGHSGGGPLMVAYQNVAENGLPVLEDPDLLSKPAAGLLSQMTPADALVLLDSHAGYAVSALLGLDPAIVDESRPAERDPKLDMFLPSNGHRANGPRYDPEFLRTFLEAQAARMSRLVDHAQLRLALIDKGQGDFPDDEPMVVAAVRSRIWVADPNLLGRTRAPWPILRDGRLQPPEVAPSVRRPKDLSRQSSALSSTLVTSVRRFLATHAIRTFSDYTVGCDEVKGVDWASSFTSAPKHLEGVTVPLLSMVMTGHYFLVANELMFERCASVDKEMAMVEGAQHNLRRSGSGKEGRTITAIFDHIANWAAARL